jgi:hypothetical protein
MNQLIKELREQATYTVKGANGCVWGDNVNLEKFAELLVEEFLEIADSNLHPQAYVQILAAVQQRFGIK